MGKGRREKGERRREAGKSRATKSDDVRCGKEALVKSGTAKRFFCQRIKARIMRKEQKTILKILFNFTACLSIRNRQKRCPSSRLLWSVKKVIGITAGSPRQRGALLKMGNYSRYSCSFSPVTSEISSGQVKRCSQSALPLLCVYFANSLSMGRALS